MKTPRRTIAMLAVSCLIAAACGAAETKTNASAEEQLVELEEQLAELQEQESQTGEQEQASGEAEPEPAAPAATLEDESEDNDGGESEEAEEPATTEPTGGGGLVGEYAEPTGPLLSEEMSLDEVRELTASMVGRTTDVGGDLARLTRFPAAVVTMPGTEVIEVNAVWGPDRPRRSSKQNSRVEVTMFANATPEDVALTYETQLAAAGFEIKQAS